MTISRKNIAKLTLVNILLITGLFGNACTNFVSNNVNANSNSAQSESNTNQATKDDVSELLTIVRLPEVPEEVVWREEPAGKTADPAGAIRKLTAVLRYDGETAAKLVAQIEKNKQPEQAEIGAESWFPEELIAQTQISGNEMLKGAAYGANDFLNVPYGNGKITRVENTNYFVLELYAS